MPAKKDELAKVRIHSHWDTLLLWLNGREWKVSNESQNKSNVLQHSQDEGYVMRFMLS